MDLKRAIGQRIGIAENLISSCRQAEGIKFSPDYNTGPLLLGLVDAQKHFEASEQDHVVLHGTSLEARRHTAALLAKFIEPGKPLHRLILHVLRDVLDGDENAPTTDISGKYECRLYAASLEGANKVIDVLQNPEAG